MTAGLILLIVTGVLIAFGVGQRALDRLRLTDTQAFVVIALTIALGFVPAIPLGRVQVNLGGCVVPLALCVYLFVKADTAWEKGRSVLAAVVTGGVIWAMMRFLPNEPDRPLTPRDMQLAPAQCRPPTAIIMDGVFLPERLKATGNTESWLTKQMELQGFKDVKDIFLATVDADNALSIYEKNEDVPAKPFYS